MAGTNKRFSHVAKNSQYEQLLQKIENCYTIIVQEKLDNFMFPLCIDLIVNLEIKCILSCLMQEISMLRIGASKGTNVRT